MFWNSLAAFNQSRCLGVWTMAAFWPQATGCFLTSTRNQELQTHVTSQAQTWQVILGPIFCAGRCWPLSDLRMQKVANASRKKKIACWILKSKLPLLMTLAAFWPLWATAAKIRYFKRFCCACHRQTANKLHWQSNACWQLLTGFSSLEAFEQNMHRT